MSVEHVIPEGLGNDHLILPRGVVCDDCNHGKLSGLDREFLEFLPIALMRITHGLRTKAGKLPSARFGNAHVHMPDEASIVIEQHGGRAVHPTEEGFRLTLEGRRRGGPRPPRVRRRSRRGRLRDVTRACGDDSSDPCPTLSDV